jgi:hypothetical protein
VLDQHTGAITRSANIGIAAEELHMLRDGALAAWNCSFQSFSADGGKTWTPLPKVIRGYAYGCGYGDSVFFLREGIVSEVRGEDVRQGRLKERIVAHGDPKARTLVMDEDLRRMYTVVEKDGGSMRAKSAEMQRTSFFGTETRLKTPLM